jgi:hypothetical protein
MADKNLTAGMRDTLVLVASGTPLASGKYTYTFMTEGANKETGSFEITFKGATKGSFNKPAKSCLEIYTDDPNSKDGEYWIQPNGGTKQKCYCDMTNGGYTMIWSYSEKAAREEYGSNDRMGMGGTNYYLSTNLPTNRKENQGDNINYSNWRMSLDDMKGVMASWTSPIRVRIATNATNMNDEWGKNNYAELTPASQAVNPISTSSGNAYVYPDSHGSLTGKLYGQDWIVSGSTHTVGGYSYGNGALYRNDWGNYGTHWNMGGSINNNAPTSNVKVTVVPSFNGTQTIKLNTIDNVFGYYGDTQSNHHFGKCRQNGDDYSFIQYASCPSGDLYPHSFNNGEGRYCQWFVK